MDIDFLEYKVRNGDTLNSIASRLGITGEELKLFHNSHCQRMNRIWFDNLNEVKSVFVPIYVKTEKQKDQERKNALPSSPLSDSFFAKTYKVTEAFKSPFEPSLTVDYSVHLNVRKDKNRNHYLLSYSQDHFISNGNPPDAKMSSLSITCMESIMPIDFIINEQGKIIGLADHKKVTQTFAEKRKDLQDFFIGEIAEKYMDTFEKNIADEEFFLQQFQSTLVFQVLLPKMDWFHKKTDWTENLYFLQNSFSIPCNMNIVQEDENKDHIKTSLRGSNTEFYSLQEIKSGHKFNQEAEDPVSGEFIIEYTTHKKNKNLLQASGNVHLWREAESVQQHTITITQG
ncbi:uncharacterized protein CHSO_1518 [Chryseobacterium sp. StRB126]|uniref:LysM peptidoglycan-binding domain-containing protein n=1 Tax=Chryseobacterium sp. StRB126 TaxID=878220 RepID=UPI0004E98C7A|nr:LysM peptidoglycan-binding domain-containing protein [Chryseobacterium sp. StRB126]BAP30555.1 uncharacterized protein CHSO_1518 [Chryseobacterium sp. StRB126]